MRERSFLGWVGLIGAVALLALAANAILNDRVPAAWMFAIAIFGTIIIAGGLTAATRSMSHR